MFNKKIDFIQKEKRCIFKINNFLDQEFYNQLENNFPDIDTKKIDLNKSFGKKFIDNEDPNLDLQNQSTILQKFDDLIKSKTFFDFFLKSFIFMPHLRKTIYFAELNISDILFPTRVVIIKLWIFYFQN